MLVASTFTPSEPATHVVVQGHRLAETDTGWRTVLLIVLRFGALALVLVAALHQQKTVHAIGDDDAGEEQETVPHDRPGGVDAPHRLSWRGSR